jgi:catechol 2,3-dioxygenase-like lactoylglutathione lyase family enzyme
MSVSGLHHFTIRCAPADLPRLKDFYTGVLQLTPGDRPVFPAPGYWLYSKGQAIVHLYAGEAQTNTGPTGPLDHISFRAHDLDVTREFLRAGGIAFDELPVPGWPLHQLFLRDPFGLKIELTFDLDEEARNGHVQPA